MHPIEKFWTNLETECFAECCGIDAFDLWPQSITKASSDFDIDELKYYIDRLKNEVVKSPRKVVSSTMLNNLFEKSVFIQVIGHISAQIQ